MTSPVAFPSMSGRWLCLVSQSPRRRKLLGLFGIPMSVRPAHGVDEQSRPGESPEALVRRLSRAKACAVASTLPSYTIVVAADTVVALDGHILGKPLSLAEAVHALRQLRGRTHQVYTGVTVIDLLKRRLMTDVSMTDVPMREYGEDEIDAYVASGDPLDKAGSYAIQHPTFRPVADLRGCYANVMGLPLCHVARMLRRLGFAALPDVPAACLHFTSYLSPIATDILSGDAPEIEEFLPENQNS